MANPSISRQFSHWAANLKYEDLSPEVVDKVKALILHGLAGAVLGGDMPKVKEAIELTKKEEGRADGATIIWDGGKATRLGRRLPMRN